MRDEQKKAELDAARKKAEEEAEDIKRKLAEQGIETSARVVPAGDVSGELDLMQQAGVESNKAITECKEFRVEDFLNEPECFGEGSQLSALPKEKIEQLKGKIQSRVTFLEALYLRDRVSRAYDSGDVVKGSLYTPQPAEWLLVQNAITRDAVRQMVKHAKDSHVPATPGQQASISEQVFDGVDEMKPRQLFKTATANIGLPFRSGSRSLVDQIMHWKCAGTINHWHQGKIDGMSAPPNFAIKKDS